MLYDKIKNSPTCSTRNLQYAMAYGGKHNVPVADVLETIKLAEQQKLATKALLAKKVRV